MDDKCTICGADADVLMDYVFGKEVKKFSACLDHMEEVSIYRRSFADRNEMLERAHLSKWYLDHAPSIF